MFWGLSESEAAELWRDSDSDPQTERDSKGFHGALRLWIPAHEIKTREREHYVDNRVTEGSDVMKAPSLEDRRILKDMFGGSWGGNLCVSCLVTVFKFIFLFQLIC